MVFEKVCEGCGNFFTDAFAGGFVGALVAVGAILMAFLIVIIYIYHAYSWMTIGRKLKYKYSWLAWIPIANVTMILQLGGFHWAWIFLILIPFLGWIALLVMFIVATWRIFEKRKYPGWFSLSVILPQVGGILYLIAIGFVAFKNKKKRR